LHKFRKHGAVPVHAVTVRIVIRRVWKEVILLAAVATDGKLAEVQPCYPPRRVPRWPAGGVGTVPFCAEGVAARTAMAGAMQQPH